MSDIVRLDTRTGQVRTIRLYGKLGAKFGRVHRMAVDSAAEAVRALMSQLPGFDAYLTQSKDKGLVYAVFYGKKNIRKDELCNPVGSDEIRFAPVLVGSKRQGWFQIIVGVVLVIVAVAGLVVTWGGSAALSAQVGAMGWAMIIGGVIQLLTPVPKGRSAQDRPENMPSYAFNGPINTQAQGSSVPVLYGELIIGSAVLSAGINVKDDVYVPTATTGLGSGGGGGGGSAPWHLENLA